MLVDLLRHDRALVLAGLAAVIFLSWVWLLMGAGLKMDEMDMGGGRIMLMAPPWTVQYAAMIFLMWIIMMAAMMLPSAAPVILLVIALTKQRGEPHAIRASGEFAFGYVAVWGAFSLIATGLQWGLDRAGRIAFRDHGQRERCPCGLAVVRRWRLSTDALEAGVPAALPVAIGVSHAILAAGSSRPNARRRVAWGVLPRMLLDADGALVRGRPHEFALDRRTGASGADREAVSTRSAREPTRGRRLDWLGRVRSRPLTVLAVKLAEISGEYAHAHKCEGRPSLQWVQAPPGNRSSRKQPEESMEVTKWLRPSV